MYRSALKTGVFRRMPEGLCSPCSGTGRGEEIADCGEVWESEGTLAIRDCGSCRGTGMALAKTRITVLGAVLALMPVAVTWPFAGSIRWTGVALLVCRVALNGVLSRYARTRSNPVVSAAGEIHTGHTAALTTEGLLSLICVHGKTSNAPHQSESEADSGRPSPLPSSKSTSVELE
jgi:hypothetical protein